MEKDARVRNPDGPPAEILSSTDALLWTSLARLQLNIAQTASLCGISVRQLGYWTKQGYVTAEGHGERRVYGLEALRRVLSIRRLMAEGSSLRQALRSLSDPAAPAPLWDEMPVSDMGAHDSGPMEDMGGLTAALAALFDGNRQVRDSVDGLALKLGLAPSQVFRAAEALCARGVLGKSLVQNEAVYRRAEAA